MLANKSRPPMLCTVTMTSTTMASAAGSGTAAALSCIQIPHQEGTIDRIALLKSAVNVGGTLEGRIETVGAANNTGSLWAAGSSGSVTPAGATGAVQVINLTTPIVIGSADVGKPLAVVSYLSAFSASISIARCALAIGTDVTATLGAIPGNRTTTNYSIGNVLATAGTINTLNLAAALYDTDEPCFGSYALGGLPASSAIAAGAWSGVKWQPEIDSYLECVTDIGRNDGNCRYEIYDNSNNLLATSKTYAASEASATALIPTAYVFPPNQRPLLKEGALYRVVRKVISGASQTQLIIPSFSQACQESVFGIFCLTTSVNGTTWVDTPATHPGLFIRATPASSSRPRVSSPYLFGMAS